MRRAAVLKAVLASGLIMGAGLTGTCAVAAEPEVAEKSPVEKDETVERAVGQKPKPKTLENSIWIEADKAEKDARNSGERNRDAELNAYVQRVLDKVAGDYKGDIRLYVMDRPFFNASMAPNGYTEVWTGLMLRVQTEDELAFVLGHELAHFKRNHSVKAFQRAKNNQNAAMAASIVIAVVGAGAAANAGTYSAARDISNLTRGLIDVVYLGSIAAYFAYSRDTEAEADFHGNRAAHMAGYDPHAGARIWGFILDEGRASDFEKTRKSGARINVFGSHPLEVERIDALDAQGKSLSPAPLDDATLKAKRAAYRDLVRPYLAVWLAADLRRQDYGQTLYVVSRLQEDGLDPGLLNFYAGEAFRLRATDNLGSGDLVAAANAYTRAATFADAPKATQRQLGEVYRRMGRKSDAIKAFEAYLSAHPEVEDAWMVEDQVKTLKAAQDAPPVTPIAEPAQ